MREDERHKAEVGDIVRHVNRPDLGEGWIVEAADDERFLVEWSNGVVLRNKKDSVIRAPDMTTMREAVINAIQSVVQMAGEDAENVSDAALTAALSWLAAEADDSKFPGYIYWADSGGGCSLADYLRSQIPPRQEGERDV